MKTKMRHGFLLTALLGGILLTPGCSTPTVTVGAPRPANRAVVSVSSTVPTKVECAWLQDGARVQHRGTTPFHLVLPSSSIQEIIFTKPVTANDVAVEIRSSATKLGRFVMERDSSVLRLVRDGRCWGPFEQSS